MNTIPVFRPVVGVHTARSVMTRHYGSERQAQKFWESREPKPGQAKIGGWSEELREALKTKFGTDDERRTFLKGLKGDRTSLGDIPESEIFAALEKI